MFVQVETNLYISMREITIQICYAIFVCLSGAKYQPNIPALFVRIGSIYYTTNKLLRNLIRYDFCDLSQYVMM